jgi:hypothetical protein
LDRADHGLAMHHLSVRANYVPHCVGIINMMRSRSVRSTLDVPVSLDIWTYNLFNRITLCRTKKSPNAICKNLVHSLLIQYDNFMLSCKFLALFLTPQNSTSAKAKENATVCPLQRADGWDINTEIILFFRAVCGIRDIVCRFSHPCAPKSLGSPDCLRLSGRNLPTHTAYLPPCGPSHQQAK